MSRNYRANQEKGLGKGVRRDQERCPDQEKVSGSGKGVRIRKRSRAAATDQEKVSGIRKRCPDQEKVSGTTKRVLGYIWHVGHLWRASSSAIGFRHLLRLARRQSVPDTFSPSGWLGSLGASALGQLRDFGRFESGSLVTNSGIQGSKPWRC